MKKLFLICSILILISCQKEVDTTFLIGKEHVGKLKKNTPLKDLETIYALDSIVRDTLSSRIGSAKGKVRIYEKGGAHLLTLTPSADSLPVIENIRIFDPRFKTDKGIGVQSNFKQIKDAYPLRKVVTSMNNVVIFLKNSDMYFTISKEELPSSLRYAASTNIEAVQIPDEAKVKYLMVGWD
ncbi:hypothetical protein [Poritiphilus flavus]|uniref:Lipoprotein n=1 Tax=Poritiphilus flavus TaxID=2697053 RepID=A0A6L9EJB3_9FLAO|nr:hypothetical protein [Poritiphilus flavus]NAS14269.1 hypothetical protein [Poritiphilus flavus]